MKTTETHPEARRDADVRSVPRVVGAVTGVLVAGVALAAGHLAAAAVAGAGAASPILAVGQSVIDASPEWLKSFAIREFGSNDKTVLLTGIVATLAGLSAVVGALATRRRWVGYAGIGVLTAIGVAAALGRPASTPSWVIPSLVAGAAGLGTFVVLSSTWRPGPGRRGIATRRPADGPGTPTSPPVDGPATPTGFDRRRFLGAAAAVSAAAFASGSLGTFIQNRRIAALGRSNLRVPIPSSPARGLPTGGQLDVGGISPFSTSNDSFYRVDTALLVPQVDVKTWTLRIHGMVDHPTSIGFEQLVARDLIERDITLNCVSNQVGGKYIGNARWIGAPLKPLLEEAGVQAAASQIVSRSPDGMTIGTPTAIALDGRDAMLAVAMNGQPLPFAHGFPVRMLIPGLYGYESGTKWIVDMELTTLDAFDAYWVKRGWAQQVLVKTSSRIDVPKNGSRLKAGTIAVAGVAWAQHRGIDRVQVRVDGGTWSDATLAAEDTLDTWRQWTWPWQAGSGPHTIEVRAIDGTGEVQTGSITPPFPSGSTGWHAIDVVVD